MNTKRMRALNNRKETDGPIVYWMSRDQRAFDNWALLSAQELAKKRGTYVIVVFCLRSEFPHNTKRLLDFMLTGLQEIEETLYKKNIPFVFLVGDPVTEIESFCKKNKIGTLITDFNPLNWKQKWNKALVSKVSVPFYEVDTHNIVPCWIASPKQEFGAYTFRPKIHFHLQEFLEAFPPLQKQEHSSIKLTKTDWKAMWKLLKVDESVQPVDWLKPGENASEKMLQEFIDERLPYYATERNDPTKYAQSMLSPYLHFGHIAAQRIALELENMHGNIDSKNAFLEELIVRKELSDNYCFYNKNYDNPKGFPEWAIKSLEQHVLDKRDFIYTLDELKKANTHDPLWNAAQREMITRGKMHGYMRMYWAKKIFEWSKNAEDAQHNAIALNDTYFLDGRDPNGYTGIAWSIGGVHDRAWFERAIFGKIRFMNYNGAKSKFDIKKYMESV